MKKITLSELAYAMMMAVACAASYLVTSRVIGPFIDRGDSLLGGMWAAVATAFVFRETRVGSLAAGVSRLVATFVSFALCSISIALLPVNAGGIVLLIGAGAIVMQSFRRPEDIITRRSRASCLWVLRRLIRSMLLSNQCCVSSIPLRASASVCCSGGA